MSKACRKENRVACRKEDHRCSKQAEHTRGELRVEMASAACSTRALPRDISTSMLMPEQLSLRNDEYGAGFSSASTIVFE